jgi:hypothetical protein
MSATTQLDCSWDFFFAAKFPSFPENKKAPVPDTPVKDVSTGALAPAYL